MDFFTEYEKHVKEREALGVPPLPLNEEQTREVCELLKLESAHERGAGGEAATSAKLDENQEGKAARKFTRKSRKSGRGRRGKGKGGVFKRDYKSWA